MLTSLTPGDDSQVVVATVRILEGQLSGFWRPGGVSPDSGLSADGTGS